MKYEKTSTIINAFHVTLYPGWIVFKKSLDPNRGKKYISCISFGTPSTFLAVEINLFFPSALNR